MSMTECKHCGQEIIKYSSDATDWDRLGDDDQWVHTSPHGPHKAEPDWNTKS